MNRLFISFAVCCVFAGLPQFGWTTDYEARLHTSRDDSVKPARDILQVEFWDPNENAGYLIVTKAVTSTGSYELIGKKGDAMTPLELAQVRSVPTGGPALNLVVTPKAPLDLAKYDSFYFHPKDASLWRFKGGGTWHYQGGGSILVIKNDAGGAFVTDSNYYRQHAGVQNSLQTAHNLKGGVLSLDLHYEARTSDENTAPGAFAFLFNAKGEFVLPTKDKTSFSNSLTADVDYVYSHIPEHPLENRWEPYWDVGVSGNFESDQTFENINILGGAVAHVILRNPITDAIQRAILLKEPVFLNPQRVVDVSIAPLFRFNYDVVDHLKEGKDIHTGNNRLTSSLFYRLPLARGIDFLQKLGLTKQVFDSDFIVELEEVYDVDKQGFTDNSRLTLELRPRIDIAHQPSFTLTYARGRATPTFQHFDAFLVGLKMPF